MKKFYLVFLFIITSCSDEIEEIIPETKLIITKVEWFDVDDNKLFNTYDYKYDKDFNLIAVLDKYSISTQQYFYEDNKVVKSNFGNKYTEYTYDGELITSCKEYQLPFSGTFVRTDFEYNSKDQLISKKSYLGGNILTCQSSYTWNDKGNVETEKNSCSSPEAYTFEYDNMKNRHSLLFNIGIQKIQKITNNNQIKVFNGSSLSHTFEYEYNEFGYPTSSTVSFGVREEITYEEVIIQ